MYVIVVGGGKVGYYLTKTLLAEGHEVAIVEHDEKVCRKLELDLGEILVHADGSTPVGLELAGAARAQVVTAVTGQDETNLVTCQVARSFFHVERTIGRINNPKNEAMFRALNAGITVSSTQIITDLIQREVDTHRVQKLLPLASGKVNLFELDTAEHSPVVGQSVANLKLPPGSLLVAVLRGDDVIVPDGRTQLRPGDRLLAVAQSDREEELARLLFGAES
jgi:trk system potassium uptake protein TrkA